jgi:O-antigen/teichoic acid export membrane protein
VSSVRRSVVIYACAFAVAGATPFLLLPVLTRHLSPAQFGEVTSFLMFAALLGNFASLSAHGFVSVRYFKTAPNAFSPLVGTALGVLVLGHLLALAATALLHPLLERVLDLPLLPSLLAVVAAFCMNLCLVWLALFQSSGQPERYLQVRLIQGVLELGLGSVLVVWVLSEALARTGSYTVALAASAAFGAWMCHRRGLFTLRFERAQVKALLTFGLPLLPHIVAGTTISYLDRLVVSSLLGPQSLGFYMVAMQIGMAMVALTEPLNKALAPWLFEQLAKKDEAVRRLIVRRTYMLFAALMFVGLVMALAAHLLFDRLIGPTYAPARALIPWMVAGFVMQGLYTAVVNYLFYAERTGWLSVASASTAAMGCGVSWFMTTHYGLQGAAMSFAFNSAVLFLLVWASAAKAVPMPWWPRAR